MLSLLGNSNVGDLGSRILGFGIWDLGLGFGVISQWVEGGLPRDVHCIYPAPFQHVVQRSEGILLLAELRVISRLKHILRIRPTDHFSLNRGPTLSFK